MSVKIPWQRAGLFLLDAVLVALSLFAAYLLRFPDFVIPASYELQYVLVVPVFVAVRLVLFWRFNLYRGILRYASTTELVAIFVSVTLGSVLLSAANVFLVRFLPAPRVFSGEAHFPRVPLQILIIEYFITIMLVGGGRFSRRLLLAAFARSDGGEPLKRILIVGAGDAGEAVARSMRQALTRAYEPVAFVDDDPQKLNLRIHGIPVAGAVSDIVRVIGECGADEVLVAIPRVAPAKLREIVQLCEHARVGLNILPSVEDVFTGRVSVSQMRRVEIEDLLGREEVCFDLAPERNYIKGQTILITGAGGSIGSELCRQLMRFDPKRLVLMGKGENSIYEIATELNPRGDGGLLCPVIGDIRDSAKVSAVMAQFSPAIVFHAAAHKHVPLMEMHPDEAVKNNIIGTLNVARASEAAGVTKFILISSDKAVRPTNVMGATKRVAEMIIFCMARASRTQFVAVRFGNVLGSRGSVIPMFKRQIARGGPVTVTHPDVTRFFMTIPEAVSLVIQAGSRPEQRRLYLLDMGQPVRIIDLAHNLIRLSGFEPGKDIKIEITGLRPGEKLIEELLTSGENVTATEMGKIFSAEPDNVDCEALWRDVEVLRAMAESADAEAIRRTLRKLAPDYSPRS
ncbi:MAG: nucleoside-diphosphate sugar epimerase/dehydratase [bacterium]